MKKLIVDLDLKKIFKVDFMEPKILQILSPENLRFLGEGNEHLVFSIVNSDNVLRFRKVLPGDVSNRIEFMLRVENDMRFTNGVVELLAGPLLADKADFISVDPSLLKKVMKEIKGLRDVRRLQKTVNRFGLGLFTPNSAQEFVNRISHRSTHGFGVLTAFQHSQTSFTLNKSFMPLRMRKFREEDSSSTKTKKATHSNNPKSKRVSQQNHQESQMRFCNCSSGSSGNPHFIHEINCRRLNQTSHLVQQITEATKSMQQDNDNMEGRYKESASNKPKKICVELKPKQGFLEPFEEGSLCRFCLKQYIKVKEKTEISKSSYCPQDLYSGDLILMKKALRDLFSSPQNNLKIFSNGKAVSVSHYDEYRYLTDLIVKILMHKIENPSAHYESEGVISENEEQILESQDQKSSPKQICSESLSESSEIRTHDKHIESETESVPDEYCDIVDKFSLPLYNYIPTSTMLPSTSILGRILQMQCLGQISDLQAAIFYKELCKRFHSQEALHQRIADFQIFTETFPISMVNKKDGKISWVRLDMSELHSGEGTATQEDIDSISTSDLIELVQQAMIAMTFKDFSLMLLMEGPFEKSPLVMLRQSPFWLEEPPGSGSWYKCQATLIDMALKCPSKLLEHETSLNELLGILNCLQRNGSEPICCKSRTEKKKL